MDIAVWFGLSLIAGIIADRKGRSGIGFFLLSVFFSPLLGIPVVLIIEPDENRQINRGTIKKCPYCCEIIKTEAVLCKYCRQFIPPKKTSSAEANHHRKDL